MPVSYTHLDVYKRQPRSINRHNYSEAEIDQVVEKPVVRKLCSLMRFRNQHPAFNGSIAVDQDSTGGKLHIRWDKDGAFAALDANFQDCLLYTSSIRFFSFWLLS